MVDVIPVDQLSEQAQDSAKAILDALEAGQVYLSREEVFAQDMIDEAFVGTDGADLRNSLAIKNLATASNIVNWHNTDSIIRQLWGMVPELPTKLASIISAKDAQTLADLFARLKAENPPVKTLDQAQQQYLAEPQAAMLGSVPANAYLETLTQIALRMAFIVNIARNFTGAEKDLAQVWLDACRQREPGLTVQEFHSRYNVDIAGISGYKRGIGYSGNFFKGLVKSVSKLFRHPLAWFKSAFKEAGRYVMLHNVPFNWLRKVPVFGAALGGIGSVFTDELARAMVSGKISTFNEQRLVRTIGEVGCQVGFILTLIGGVLTLTPLAPLGQILVAVGGLLVIAGQTILKLQAMARQQRLNREAYAAEMERLKKLKQAQNEALAATGQQLPAEEPAVKASSGNLGLVAAALAAVFMLKG